MRIIAFAIVFALVAVPALPAQEPSKKDLLLAIEAQLKTASDTVGPSVACVVVSRSEAYPAVANASETPGKLGSFDPVEFLKTQNTPARAKLALSLTLSDPRNIPDHGFGCGVVIDEKGLILTPYHVIENATKIYVHLPNNRGSYADIHAADGRSDLAVLRLITPPKDLKPVPFANVQLPGRGVKPTVTNGKLAVLVANPYVANFPRVMKSSAALGSITSIYNATETGATGDKKLSDYYYYHGALLAHDAKLNSGISGAALLNLDGELIGLTTTAPLLGLGERTPDYAFPMDDGIRRIIEVLRRGEEVEYGYLGILLGERSTNQVLIKDAVPHGPAAKAGIQAGDIITSINDVPINSYPDLLVQVGNSLAGSEIKVTLKRQRQTGDVTVKVGKLKHEQTVIASVRPDAIFGLRVDQDSILAQTLNTSTQALSIGVPSGVSVRSVDDNSPAANAFKKLGDIPKRWLITHVNGNAVSSPKEFYAATKDQKSIKLTVIDPSEMKRTEREVSFP